MDNEDLVKLFRSLDKAAKGSESEEKISFKQHFSTFGCSMNGIGTEDLFCGPY